MSTENDLLPVRMLNEFAYCPRLFHFMHVEQRFVDNHFTVEGRTAHRRVDQLDHVLPDADDKPDNALSKGKKKKPTAINDGNSLFAANDPASVQIEDRIEDPPTVSRSVPLGSDILGITAKLVIDDHGKTRQGLRAEAVPTEVGILTIQAFATDGSTLATTILSTTPSGLELPLDPAGGTWQLSEVPAGEDRIVRAKASLKGDLEGGLAGRLAFVGEKGGIDVVGDQTAEWSKGEVYVPLPRPGGDAWATIDREDGKVSVRTDRSRLDLLFQRPAQGPQCGRGLGLVHRRICGRLPDLLPDRLVSSANPFRQAAGHLARGGLGRSRAVAVGYPVHSLTRVF